MDNSKITNLSEILQKMSSYPNWYLMVASNQDRIFIRNELSIISNDISTQYAHFSHELFRLKDMLFLNNGQFNLPVFGQVISILNSLIYDINHPQTDIWNMIHPMIIKSSKNLFIDGHYANAAEDAFIEINARVKQLFSIVRPGVKVPDGDSAMTTTFSSNDPIIEFCARNSETGFNIQKGYMQMLAGSMSALRNPKAHTNAVLVSKDECMRRLMFASMLMYKIDEAVKYSKIQE